jgi:hypothetical protein
MRWNLDPREARRRVARHAENAIAAGCWRERAAPQALAPLLALSLLATLFLVYVGMGGGNVGVLLWPAAASHLFLAILLARVWKENRRAAG